MQDRLRVLVVGCGHMGSSHALAYHRSTDFEIAGLVSRNEESRTLLSSRLGGYPTFSDYEEALSRTRPDAVCICTYPDTHAEYARRAMRNAAHVFLEKPLADNLRDARELVELSRSSRRKLVVGYILQQHPSWMLFVDEARKLGKPLVMRMNLNQQSSGIEWQTHKNILRTMSPIVDCGVHYVDVMCRMTNSRPVRVHAIQARLSDDLEPHRFNYGQLQVAFEDGSIGWYEAGWGPMISGAAVFVKDVIGPLGSVSMNGAADAKTNSADVEGHTKSESLLLHHAELAEDGRFKTGDRTIETQNEPDHNELCAREQAFFARAIREDIDLSRHLESAVNSLEIVLAADESSRTGKVIEL